MVACQASLPLLWIINLRPVYPLGLFRVAGPLTHPFYFLQVLAEKRGQGAGSCGTPFQHSKHFLLLRVRKFVVCGCRVITERKQESGESSARQDVVSPICSQLLKTGISAVVFESRCRLKYRYDKKPVPWLEKKIYSKENHLEEMKQKSER